MTALATDAPLTNAQYHADTSAVSHSMLEDFRRSVRLYHGRYVAATIPRSQPSEQMLLGTALHTYLLEPHRFGDEVAIAPVVDRRSKAGKEAWAEFEAEAGDRIHITTDQFADLKRMADAVSSNAAARFVIDEASRFEASVYWIDDQTGLRCKCRPDALVEFEQGGRGIIIDLKTTRDPAPGAWRRQAANLGYHRQAAWYLDGCRQRNSAHFEHVAIVVGNTEPFDCFVYRLDRDAVQLGARQNRRDLDRLAACIRNNSWRAAEADCVSTISLPTWAFFEDQPDGNDD